MGEFRIGRKFAQHSYPDGPRGLSAAFARNSAFGPPGGSQALPALGDNVKWQAIEVGTAGGSVVPITPKVTGIVRLLCDVVVQNTAASSNSMGVEFILDGSSFGAFTVSTIDAAAEGQDGFITIPLEVVLAGSNALSIGVTHTIEVKVVPLQGGTSTSVLGISSLDIQEMPAATG